MHDIMAKTLRTPNDARSINHTIIAKKCKFKFEERLQPHYSVQALEKRLRRWGANVVCLANLASYIMIYDLIKQGVMYLQEESRPSPESAALVALWKPYNYDLEVW